jgi:FKBP-type peptidyl-prolyl cis-trans isomerase
MNRGLILFLASCVVTGPINTGNAAEETNSLKDFREKMSYSIGMNVGNNMKRGGFDPDLDLLLSGIKDSLKGQTRMTDQQAREVMNEYQMQQMKKRDEERKKLSEKNHKEGDAFLAENKQKPAIKIHTVTLADGSKAELQYKVLSEGSGETLTTNDIAVVNYRGTLINGTEFDNSAKSGRPAEFRLNQVIRGWTEALQLMKVGSKWEVYIPSTLAYGEGGKPPHIEPGATLIFEMELVGKKEQPPAPTPQPLTSDIIRVPSAEELKQGAQIEVLTPQEAERRAKEEAEKKQSEKK